MDAVDSSTVASSSSLIAACFEICGADDSSLSQRDGAPASKSLLVRLPEKESFVTDLLLPLSRWFSSYGNLRCSPSGENSSSANSLLDLSAILVFFNYCFLYHLYTKYAITAASRVDAMIATMTAAAELFFGSSQSLVSVWQKFDSQW